MRAQLIPLDGSPPLEVTRDMTVVGRKEECDLRLDHKGVSKIHCILVKTDGLLLLRDLGSTNGTRVNGQRVRRAALLPNDQVSIAGFGFRVFFGPSQARVSPHENTQELEKEEVARLERLAADDDDSSGEPAAAAPLKVNVLPDVYPDEKKEKD